MTALALALASLLASGMQPQEPPPSPPLERPEAPARPEPPTTALPTEPTSPPAMTEPPAPTETQVPTEPPTPAPPTSRIEPPDAPPARWESPGAGAARRRRELAVLAGWSAVSVAGLGADGPELRVALESRPMRSFPGVVLLTGELFGGDTSTGLLVRSVAVGAEAWVEAGPRLRLGAGVDLGLVAYRRETRSEWPMLLAPGARAGLEVAAVQWRRGAIVLGGGVAGHIGGVPWLSASVAVGFRAAGGRAGRP